MKGISPLIATVLIIAFTVAVAGIVSLWASGFAQVTTRDIQNRSEERIHCTYGSIAISDVNFCSTRNELSGRLTNNGIIDLGQITLQEVYSNGSSPTQGLCLSGSSVISCTTANLTIKPGYLYTFNISGISTGFDRVNVITDCTGVSDITKTWTTNC